MNVISVIKECVNAMSTAGKVCYRLLYAIPVMKYKTHICPAINEFTIDESFRYSPDSFFPAIMRKDPEMARKIYQRVVSFDNQGIPLLQRYEQKYWPVTIAQYGLLNYNFYLTYKDNKYKQSCLNVCEWLLNNISAYGMWEYKVEYRCLVVDEDMHPPFGSAMVQGEAIAMLVRGYLLTKKEKYLECAEKALRPYETPVEDGGVLRNFMGMPFYEEYPTKTPSLVLNGFMFSLFGLYDLSTIHGYSSERAKQLFLAGVQTLEKILPMYGGGYCSTYDLAYISAAPRKRHKDPMYHPIHVNQLIAMNSIYPSRVFEYYINEWK